AEDFLDSLQEQAIFLVGTGKLAQRLRLLGVDEMKEYLPDLLVRDLFHGLLQFPVAFQELHDVALPLMRPGEKDQGEAVLQGLLAEGFFLLGQLQLRTLEGRDLDQQTLGLGLIEEVLREAEMEAAGHGGGALGAEEPGAQSEGGRAEFLALAVIPLGEV